MTTNLPILSGADLVAAAANPNLLPVRVTAPLLRAALEILDADRDAAAAADGPALVRGFARVAQVAARLATVSADGGAGASRAQSALGDLARACDDAHTRLALLAPLLTDEQHAAVRAAFAAQA